MASRRTWLWAIPAAAVIGVIALSIRSEEPKSKPLPSPPAHDAGTLDPDGVRAVLALIRYGTVKKGPYIKAAVPVARYRLGRYKAFLLGDVETQGSIRYLYLLAVFGDTMEEPVLVVSSEAKTVSLGEGSHFLVVTQGPESDRANLGLSNDWADRGKFTERALAIAAQDLKVEGPIEELVPGAPDGPGRPVALPTASAPAMQKESAPPGARLALVQGVTVLASRPGASGTSVIADGDSVYWLECGEDDVACHGASVMKVSKAGGAAVTLASGQPTLGRLAAGEQGIYWTAQRAIQKVPRDGGAVKQVAATRGGAADLIVDGRALYWIEYRGDASAIVGAVDGGAQPRDLVTPSGSVIELIADATSFYYLQRNGPDVSLWTAPRAGGSPKRLLSPQVLPTGLSLDADSLYWATGSAGRILRMPKAGGEPADVYREAMKDRILGFSATHVDGGNLYFNDATTSRLLVVSKTGGSATARLEFPGKPEVDYIPFTVDDTHLYFATDQAIAKVVK